MEWAEERGGEARRSGRLIVMNLLWLLLELFLIELVLGSAIYLVARWSSIRPRLSQVPLVLAPAALPFIGAIWAQIFSVDPHSAAGVARPYWIVGMFAYLLYASIVASVAVPVFAKGYRAPAAVFALSQIPLAFMIWLGGAMAATGTYL
jgi:hypothetical protein